MAKICLLLGALGTLALGVACGPNNTNCLEQSCVPSGPCNCVALAACTTANQVTETCGVGMVCCPPLADGGNGVGG
ncbi:MAG TPA: hypothetical protein VMB50_00930 [Myxococcales bacterium]|nr:hypothetical protein [Myxococcales bacterium]